MTQQLVLALWVALICLTGFCFMLLERLTDTRHAGWTMGICLTIVAAVYSITILLPYVWRATLWHF